MKYTFSIKPHPTNSAIWVQLSDGESRSDKVELKGNNPALEFGLKPKALIIERKVSLLKRLTSSFHCKYLKAKGEDGSILYFPIFRNLPAGETTIPEGSAKLPWQDDSVKREQRLKKKLALMRNAFGAEEDEGILSVLEREEIQQAFGRAKHGVSRSAAVLSAKLKSGEKPPTETPPARKSRILELFLMLLQVLLQYGKTYAKKLSINVDDHSSLPSSVDGKIFFELPVDLWFGPVKILTLLLNAVLVAVQKFIRKVFSFGTNWTKFWHINRVFLFTSPKADYIKKNWKKDSLFAKQFLAGCNPIMIEKCNAVPEKIPLDALKKVCPDIETDIENGDIYMVDYKLLHDVEEGENEDQQQYVAAPIVILKQTKEEGLMPIAIQLKQTAGKDNPVFSPKDGNNWLLAKIWVRNSEFYIHELISHLLRSHLLGEVFFFSMYTSMVDNHPVLKLFMATGRYTLPINVTARNTLINDTGFFMSYSGLSMEGMTEVLNRASEAITYENLCLPDNIKLRGIENLDGFHYRDDGMDIWNAIEQFVKEVIYAYYNSDEEISKDEDLQRFFHTACVKGFKSNMEGLPSHVPTRDEAVKYLTMVMFTCSAQHAAVNNGQFDIYAWMPNGPTTMRQPPPKKKVKVTEKYIMNTLPDKNTTLEAMAVARFLSQVSKDFVPLGQYSQEISNEPHFEEPIKRFQDSLKKIGEKIDKRSSEEFHYDYLHPAHMENSIAV